MSEQAIQRRNKSSFDSDTAKVDFYTLSFGNSSPICFASSLSLRTRKAEIDTKRTHLVIIWRRSSATLRCSWKGTFQIAAFEGVQQVVSSDVISLAFLREDDLGLAGR